MSFPPFSSNTFLTFLMSSSFLAKEIATKSYPCSQAVFKSAISLSASPGNLITVPGKFIVFLLPKPFP